MPVITGSLLTVWRSLVSSERWMMRSHLYSWYLQYYLETERAVAVARLHPSNKTLSILSWELTLSGNQLVLTFCDKLADRQTVLMRLNVPCCLRFLCCSNLRFVFQRVAWLNWLNSGGWVGHMGTWAHIPRQPSGSWELNLYHDLVNSSCRRNERFNNHQHT